MIPSLSSQYGFHFILTANCRFLSTFPMQDGAVLWHTFTTGQSRSIAQDIREKLFQNTWHAQPSCKHFVKLCDSMLSRTCGNKVTCTRRVTPSWLYDKGLKKLHLFFTIFLRNLKRKTGTPNQMEICPSLQIEFHMPRHTAVVAGLGQRATVTLLSEAATMQHYTNLQPCAIRP